MKLAFALPFTLIALAACGEDAPLGDCPPDSETEQLAGRTYIEGSCAIGGCHGMGASQGGVSLDSLSAIQSRTQDIYNQVEGGSMPPSNPAPASVVEQVRVFLACGADAGQ